MACALAATQTGAFEGRLVSTDAYSWLNRVVDLHADHDWFDDTIDRINPPVGHRQHWSRPFDVILLSGALIGAPFAGFSDALLAWGTVLPVLLGAATIVVLWWGFADVLDAAGVRALAALIGVQPLIFGSFAFGRPDHHTLILLLAVTALSLARRSGRHRTASWAVAAGTVSGLGVWVGTEFALLIVAVLVAGAVEWVVRGDETMRQLVAFSASLTGAAAVGLTVENGLVGWTTVQLDELSPIVVAFGTLATLATATLHAVTLRGASIRTRTIALVLALTAGATALVAAFPSIADGPLGPVDPLYARTRLRNIREIQSLVGAPLGAIVRGLSLLPFALIALAGVRRNWRTSIDQQLHLLVIAAAVYLPLAVMQQRWLFMLNLVLAVPAALGLQRLMHAIAPRAARVHLGMMSIAVVAALWWLPVTATSPPQATARCGLDAAVEVLNDDAGFGGVPRRLMAQTDHGPELLFRTPHSVMSIPNHRPQPGFTATYDAMTASAWSEARVHIDEAGIGLLLVCGDPAEVTFYGASPTSVHRHLVRGEAPTWLREVPLPATDVEAPRPRLYEVLHDAEGEARRVDNAD